MEEPKVIAIQVNSVYHRMVKSFASERGQSIKEFCLAAIHEKIMRESAQTQRNEND